MRTNVRSALFQEADLKLENRRLYEKFISEQNTAGSNKASSYLRALELLASLLARKGGALADCADIYSVRSLARITTLYEFILEQQRLGDKGIFGGETPSSYWRKHYYSAALGSYLTFLIHHSYKARLWHLYRQSDTSPAELASQLNRQKTFSFKRLFSEADIDFSTKRGKDALRQVKMRINQDFFREMIMHEYGTQCCVTGLNVPGVLRASHIVGWVEDRASRMNPANGLCLSATYDAAFDRHLISFDENFRMILGSELKKYYSNAAFKTHFLSFEGQRIQLPKRYPPEQIFLQKHREKMR